MAEIPGNVVGIRRQLKFNSVALITVLIRQLIVAVDVARLAESCGVAAAQWKSSRVVIE